MGRTPEIQQNIPELQYDQAREKIEASLNSIKDQEKVSGKAIRQAIGDLCKPIKGRINYLPIAILDFPGGPWDGDIDLTEVRYYPKDNQLRSEMYLAQRGYDDGLFLGAHKYYGDEKEWSNEESWNRYGRRIVGMLEKAMKALSEGKKIDDRLAMDWISELEHEETDERFREIFPNHPCSTEYAPKETSK